MGFKSPHRTDDSGYRPVHEGPSGTTVDHVTWWLCAFWGLFGGAAVEGLEITAAIKRTGHWPWGRRKRIKTLPALVAMVIRLFTGSGLAVAVGTTGPMTALSAVGVGVAAPLILEKLAQQVPIQT